MSLLLATTHGCVAELGNSALPWCTCVWCPVLPVLLSVHRCCLCILRCGRYGCGRTCMHGGCASNHSWRMSCVTQNCLFHRLQCTQKIRPRALQGLMLCAILAPRLLVLLHRRTHDGNKHPGELELVTWDLTVYRPRWEAGGLGGRWVAVHVEACCLLLVMLYCTLPCTIPCTHTIPMPIHIMYVSCCRLS